MRSHSPGWIPNQHGAWAMVASPLLVGWIAGGFAWVLLPLTAFWFIGYFAFFATSLWLKARRRAKWFPPVRCYTVLAVAAGLVVVALDPSLVRWAPVFVVPLGVGLWAASRRQDRDLLVGLATVVGASAMTVVAYDAGSGQVDTRAWLLAAVQALYFAGTVFYVKSAIRERGNRGFLILSIGYHVLATGAAFAINPWLGALFAVLTARAAILPPLGLTPKTLGIGEVFATIAVAVLSLILI